MDGSFRWEDLDQRLVSPKLSELVEEMQKRAAEAPRLIASETRKSGNSARYVPQFLQFHEQLADEWVAKTYVAHCDAWNRQGRALCAPLIRGIRDRVVTPMLSARTSSVKFELSLYFTRTGYADTGSLDEWSRRMDRLGKRWQSKLEADAVACEYQELERRQPKRGFWKALHDKFNALSMEERGKLKSQQTGNRRHPLSMSIIFESEDAEWGICSLSGGVSEGFRSCFELEATQAGVAIGKQVSRSGLDVWLHHVFNDCTKHKSELLLDPIPGKRGIVERVCEASSIACARLERELADTGAAWEHLGEATQPVEGVFRRYMERLSEDSPSNLSQQNESGTGAGRLALGKTISILYDELKRLKAFARGRRKSEETLRQQFPDFQLWKEIEASSSLPDLKRKEFFLKTLDSHGQQQLMSFIGNIVAYEGDTAYKIWKEYRTHSGLKRSRRPSNRPSKAISKGSPKQRP